MSSEKRTFDLEDRLIDFSVMLIQISEEMPNSKAGNHLSGQLIRSGTSPALNYGEAQSAESRKDLVHKMKLSLKELRETLVNLKIVRKATLYGTEQLLIIAMKENNELIAIFVTSIATAQKNMQS